MASIKDDEVAQIGKALGDPNRLAVYTQIAEHEELCCSDMHAKNAISNATLSHHLKVLTELGLVSSRKEGLNVYYRTVPEKLSAYLRYLKNIGTSLSR
ncbi:ArsR/SmtB family transcription factor [Terriglobus saanensis]|uniref:Transcriptional regulator, ArsR family n=1 Tax=Terriglobus saanensis (strain ATCC BAA-1853 / DSM 23119 / SP1PR4) TaxID=401053 RepID=E8UZV0_TERSS|nr:metalloregulator ArsR/SmtB family transcription factor [Terriglobus saanensis]ADV81027.1 transcriptional regulator, ArsR family [Terriglobus saanensis SP1PR4]